MGYLGKQPRSGYETWSNDRILFQKFYAEIYAENLCRKCALMLLPDPYLILVKSSKTPI